MLVLCRRVNAVLWLAGWLTPLAAAAQPAAAPGLPVLTTVKAIRALTQDEAARAYPVRVRATVTHIDEVAHVSLVIHDGQLGQFVMPPLDLAAVPAWAELRRGDLVDIEGRTERGGFAPNIASADEALALQNRRLKPPWRARRILRRRRPPGGTSPWPRAASGPDEHRVRLARRRPPQCLDRAAAA